MEADVYLYSGLIDSDGAVRFIEEVEANKSRDNAALVLTSYGGTADGAYKIARHLNRRYKKFTLYVFGPCKSAATLVALAADEIVMSCAAEFGPLDVQLLKRDELIGRNSGLDIAEALKSVSEHAFSLFEKHFIETLTRSGGAIGTKTASEIAEAIAIGLLSPITEQIDPLQIGEVRRAVRVAKDYATRLKADARVINRLVEGYPSHTFVIDFEEAQEIFNDVRLTDLLENRLGTSLAAASFEGTGHDCVTEPYPHGVVVMPLQPEVEESDEPEQGQIEPERRSDGDDNTDAENEPSE